MDAQPYSNRELDAKFDSIHEKLDLVLTQTTATNGKVRKIILTLALVSGLVIGLGLTEASRVLPLLLIA